MLASDATPADAMGVALSGATTGLFHEMTRWAPTDGAQVELALELINGLYVAGFEVRRRDNQEGGDDV